VILFYFNSFVIIGISRGTRSKKRGVAMHPRIGSWDGGTKNLGRKEGRKEGKTN